MDPTTFSDLDIMTIRLNIISTAIWAGLSTTTQKLFRQQDIFDHLYEISLQDQLNYEFSEINETDTLALEKFFKTDTVTDILSQIYLHSDKSSKEIEKEFIKIFCKVRPLGKRSNKDLGNKLFFCINHACYKSIHLRIANGMLLGHEYMSEARHKTTLERLDRMEQCIEQNRNEILVELIKNRHYLNSEEGILLAEDTIENNEISDFQKLKCDVDSDQKPVEILREIIKKYEIGIFDSKVTFNGLLKDYFQGGFKRETNILITSVNENIPQDFLAKKDQIPFQILSAQCIQRLEDCGYSKDLSIWAINTWAKALDMNDEDLIV